LASKRRSLESLLTEREGEAPRQQVGRGGGNVCGWKGNSKRNRTERIKSQNRLVERGEKVLGEGRGGKYLTIPTFESEKVAETTPSSSNEQS